MRYRLRTLLIVLALGPPVVAGAWWGHRDWEERQRRRQRFAELKTLIETAKMMYCQPPPPDLETALRQIETEKTAHPRTP